MLGIKVIKVIAVVPPEGCKFDIAVGSIDVIDKITGDEEVVSNLALENIDALASGEGSGNIGCALSGDIDCFGHKVKYRIEDYSLD